MSVCPLLFIVDAFFIAVLIVVEFFFIVVFIGRGWVWDNNWLCIFATPIVIPRPTLTLAPIPNPKRTPLTYS